jgi:demethylmenaquinone methyltransferase/2-methoxy-6-polyprenyl-1,4-benzoquinol methylase
VLPSSRIPDRTLDEQRAYYAGRAPEYDEWWLRRGRYDRGEAENRRWFDEVAELQAIIDSAGFTGDVLELAAGTGNWTERLARQADRLTALDASDEMIALNRERLAKAGLLNRVTYERADLFTWQPERQYDGVFFGFWLSHVPSDRVEGFLARVADALQPAGKLALVDSRPDARSTSPDQPLPPEGVELSSRRLNDGRTFEIVKRYDDPEQLAATLARHGLEVRVGVTANYFLHAVGRKRR